MPGFEIRVPEELPAAKARLVVQSRLIDIDVIIKQEASDIDQTRISSQFGKQRIAGMYREY